MWLKGFPFDGTTRRPCTGCKSRFLTLGGMITRFKMNLAVRSAPDRVYQSKNHCAMVVANTHTYNSPSCTRQMAAFQPPTFVGDTTRDFALCAPVLAGVRAKQWTNQAGVLRVFNELAVPWMVTLVNNTPHFPSHSVSQNIMHLTDRIVLQSDFKLIFLFSYQVSYKEKQSFF